MARGKILHVKLRRGLPKTCIRRFGKTPPLVDDSSTTEQELSKHNWRECSRGFPDRKPLDDLRPVHSKRGNKREPNMLSSSSRTYFIFDSWSPSPTSPSSSLCLFNRVRSRFFFFAAAGPNVCVTRRKPPPPFATRSFSHTHTRAPHVNRYSGRNLEFESERARRQTFRYGQVGSFSDSTREIFRPSPPNKRGISM